MRWGFLLFFAFSSAHTLAGEIEAWHSTLKIGDKEAGLSQTFSQTEGETLSNEEAEEIEKFAAQSDFPIVYFNQEDDESSRNPSSTSHSEFVDRLKARFKDRLQIIRFSKEKLKQAHEGALRLGQFFSQAPQIFLDEARKNGPTSHNVSWGIVHVVFQTTVKGLAWFAAPGISPLVAFGITAGYGAYTVAGQIYQTAWDRTFQKHLEASEGKPQASSEKISPDHLMRRRTFNYLFLGLLTLASGGTQLGVGFHNLLQALPALTILVEGRNLVASQTSKLFRTHLTAEKTLLASRLSNLIMFCVAPLGLIDMAGASPILFTLGGYAIHATLPGVLAAYLGIWAGLRYAPDKFIAFLKLPDQFRTLAKKYSFKLKRAIRETLDGLPVRRRATRPVPGK